MKKPDSLRAALVATMPELAVNPAQLIMWVDQGGVASPITSSFSFAYRYRLNILLLGFGGYSAVLMIAILSWLRIQQPELLQPAKEAISFEADFLDAGSVDLQLAIELTEQVRSVRRVDGGFDMEFMAEPDPLLVDDLAVSDAVPLPDLTSLWFEGERLLPDAPLP